jgi:hypothetical protein
MTPATSKSTNLDVVVGDRGERKAVYGYVYVYVYGEEKKIRTSASSRRLKSGAAHAARSAASTCGFANRQDLSYDPEIGVACRSWT